MTAKTTLMGLDLLLKIVKLVEFLILRTGGNWTI